MDVAYDHIQEEALSPEEPKEGADGTAKPATNLNAEFRDAYRAFTNSSWGVTLGGFFGQVKKQGESYYEGARQEISAASTEASRGLEDLRSSIVNRTRGISTTQPRAGASVSADPTNAQTVPEITTTAEEKPAISEAAERPESLPADIVKEAEGILARFRVQAAARLKALEKAEDAADEALLRFGTNIRDFLRDAVTISAPTEDELASSMQKGNKKGKTTFESKDAEGRLVIHATRFDASLYAIHSRLASFTTDPPSDEFATWKEKFDLDAQTEAIAKDLEKHEELRRSMEQLVPEKVEYKDFWTRYYFLRHVIETEEQKRRELLKGTQAEDEEVGWGEDDSDEEQPPTPKTGLATDTTDAAADKTKPSATKPGMVKSPSSDLLKPVEPRRSNEHSIADSDASYDIVSGATSRSPGSPKEEKDRKAGAINEESDEEDWE